MATGAMQYLKRGISVFFEYDTPKIVHIRSKSIGIANRLVQLLVIGYLIGWVFIYKKGYQQEDVGIAGTTTKVKGVAYTDINDPRVGSRVWDASDIVIPAEENNAFFVMTNMILTNQQEQSVCPESATVEAANCSQRHDLDCLPVNTPYLLGHGVTNGTCNIDTETCFVRAWCPIELDKLATNSTVLPGTKEFTVLIKNHVYFPFYNKTRSNIIESSSKKYLQRCTYNSDTDPFCPVFKIGYIVDKAQAKINSDQTYDELAYEG